MHSLTGNFTDRQAYQQVVKFTARYSGVPYNRGVSQAGAQPGRQVCSKAPFFKARRLFIARQLIAHPGRQSTASRQVYSQAGK